MRDSRKVDSRAIDLTKETCGLVWLEALQGTDRCQQVCRSL